MRDFDQFSRTIHAISGSPAPRVSQPAKRGRPRLGSAAATTLHAYPVLAAARGPQNDAGSSLRRPARRVRPRQHLASWVIAVRLLRLRPHAPRARHHL